MSQVPIVYHDLAYRRLLGEIWAYGESKEDRTGTGTLSIFGGRMEFNLKNRFPLLTGKKVHFKSVAEELFWFLRGESNIKTLNASIWDEWADENGDCGPIYGAQWRSWPIGESGDTYDQLDLVIQGLKADPDSRRHIVSAWNVSQLDEMTLPPCHLLFQFYVSQGKYLNCQMYQRSCDMFLGVPFNIASYALLTHIVAYMTGLTPGRFIWIGGDCHIYCNHIKAVETYLQRTPRYSPILKLSPERWRGLEDWKFEDLILTDYNPHDRIKAEVSV